MILVVGATGQLGTAVVGKATAAGRPVRAFARRSSEYGHLRAADVELHFGDLLDAASVRAACSGAEAVIATATSVFPRGRDRMSRDELAGYRHLVNACREERVPQLVFTSIVEFPEPFRSRVPTLRLKRSIESLILDSDVPHTIFRAGPFMDDYFALMGSAIPLRGAQNATLRRPFWLASLYLRLAAQLIERRGLALVPGPASTRHSFIALDDVAEFLLRAVGHPQAIDACYDLGGPEPLCWSEVAEIYSGLLGRPVRSLSIPPALARLAASALRPFSEAASNQLGILWALASRELTIEGRRAADLFGVRLTTAREFLATRIALPAG